MDQSEILKNHSSRNRNVQKEEMCSEIAYVRNISSCVIFPPLNPADTIHFHPSKKSI